jgi:hypothetical protein
MAIKDDLKNQQYIKAGRNYNLPVEQKTFSNGGVTIADLGKFAMLDSNANVIINDGSKIPVGIISEVAHTGVLVTLTSELVIVKCDSSVFAPNDEVFISASGLASKTGTVSVGIALAPVELDSDNSTKIVKIKFKGI